VAVQSALLGFLKLSWKGSTVGAALGSYAFGRQAPSLGFLAAMVR
jgi:hypothetical protein